MSDKPDEIQTGTDYIAAAYAAIGNRPKVPTYDELRAEVERLRGELSSDESIDRAVWKTRAERAEAEIERLRAELRTCQETLTACLETS